MEEDRKEEKKKSSEEEVFPAEEQGILPEETSEEKKLDIDLGERDEDLDTPEGREEQVENAEIDAGEAGFMEGASGGGQLAKDALTGEPLMDVEDVVEIEIDGKRYRFVNEENAQKFRERREDEE
tara:strand:- start:842 stop:1216 length:375 start_codon:yes stop_codon:yes gene_type:complete